MFGQVNLINDNLWLVLCHHKHTYHLLKNFIYFPGHVNCESIQLAFGAYSSLLYVEVMCNNCHSTVLLWVLCRGQACLLSMRAVRGSHVADCWCTSELRRTDILSASGSWIVTAGFINAGPGVSRVGAYIYIHIDMSLLMCRCYNNYNIIT